MLRKLKRFQISARKSQRGLTDMTTTAKRLPVFGVPSLVPDAPDFVSNLESLAKAHAAMREFSEAAAVGKLPSVELLRRVQDGIAFFAVPGDREYAREFLSHCSLNELMQCAGVVTVTVQDYGTVLASIVDGLKQGQRIKPPAADGGTVSNGE